MAIAKNAVANNTDKAPIVNQQVVTALKSLVQNNGPISRRQLHNFLNSHDVLPEDRGLYIQAAKLTKYRQGRSTYFESSGNPRTPPPLPEQQPTQTAATAHVQISKKKYSPAEVAFAFLILAIVGVIILGIVFADSFKPPL